jgi:hypothetical protein
MYDNGRGGLDQVVRVPPGTVVSIEREVSGLEDDNENFNEEMDDDTSDNENEEQVEYDEDGEVVTEGNEDATAQAENKYCLVQELGTLSLTSRL